MGLARTRTIFLPINKLHLNVLLGIVRRRRAEGNKNKFEGGGEAYGRGGAVGRGKPSDWRSGGGEQVRILLGSPKLQHENSVKEVYYFSALSEA